MNFSECLDDHSLRIKVNTVHFNNTNYNKDMQTIELGSEMTTINKPSKFCPQKIGIKCKFKEM